MERPYESELNTESSAAVGVLARMEVDFGLTMVEWAVDSLKLADMDEYHRMRNLAASALESVALCIDRVPSEGKSEMERQFLALKDLVSKL